MELKQLYELTQQWVEAAGRLGELGLRKRFLTDRLGELSADALAEALYFIIRNAQMGRSIFQGALEAVFDLEPLIELNGRPFFSDVYTYAQNKSYDEVVNFLVRPKPKAGLKREFLPELNQLANEMTLGERRALAMTPDANVIERLLFDPDPMVIRQLLQNPRLTQTMVVRITAHRPNNPLVLAEVYGAAKWIVHYDIKVALVRNPYTPPQTSLRLLASLRAQDLRAISQDSTLVPEIRQTARELLNRRAGLRPRTK